MYRPKRIAHLRCSRESTSSYLRVYYQYDPLWKSLDKEAIEKVRKGNYERIFDDARERVRSWERTH